MKYLILMAVILAALGCGSAAPDPQIESNRLESATKLRAAFDKVGGDYEKLSAEDRTALITMFQNNEDNLRRTWTFMKERGQTAGSSSPGGSPSGN